MIIRRRDVTRWGYLFNNARGRIMLITLFLEMIAFVLMTKDADKSFASIHRRAASNNSLESLILTIGESLVDVNEEMEEMGMSQYNALNDSFYEHEKYELLPDFEKEFERRMDRSKLSTPAQNGDTGSDTRKDDFLKKTDVKRHRRANGNEDAPDHQPHVTGTFFWYSYILFYVYNYFVTFGMISLRMFYKVGGETSFRIFLITVALDITLMILATIAVSTWEVPSTIPIVSLGAVILLSNTLLHIDFYTDFFDYLVYHFHDKFNLPPSLPHNPTPNQPQMPSRNRPTKLSLSPQPSQPPNTSLNLPQMARGGGNVDEASAGSSGIAGVFQPRSSELETGKDDGNNPNVDLGDVGRSSPKVRFALENEQAENSVVTYVPGRSSPISSISKTVILENKNGKEKETKERPNLECIKQDESLNESLEHENKAISLEDLEKKDNCMKLSVQVSLDPKLGNGKQNETGERKELENNPKSRSFKETKNKLGPFKKCSCNNNCNHNDGV